MPLLQARQAGRRLARRWLPDAPRSLSPAAALDRVLERERQPILTAPAKRLAAGGAITHHHVAGRTHRPWYDRQHPEPFAAALRAAKRQLDPVGTQSGVLVD